MAAIVQSVSNGSNLGAFDGLLLPSNVTPGNVLVYLVTHSKIGDPQPPETTTVQTLGGNAAWTHLGSFKYAMSGGGEQWAVGAYAKVANGTEKTHRNLLGGENSCGIWEISGAGLADLSIVENSGSGTSINAGSLGSPASGAVAMMVAAQYTFDATVTLTPTAFTTDQTWGTATFGNTRPWWYGHAAGTGSALSGVVTSNVSQPWAAIGVLAAGDPSLSCAFSGTPLTGDAPLTVAFTDATTGTPTSWAWSFGDGGTSTSQNPSHNYTVAGTYTVSLTATRASDSDTCTHTVTAYVAVSRPVAPGVYIDWDNDGFDNGIYDDVTANAVSWRITRGSGPELTGGSQPGSCTLVLKNPANIYNPRNASSPLYGLLHDGPPIWIGVNTDGTMTGANPRGLFGGRITDITVLPGEGTTVPPFVEIVCEDFLAWSERVPINVAFAEGRSHAALRLAALTAGGETRYSLAGEIETMPLSHAEGNLRTTLDNINAVTGTRHFAKPENDFHNWYKYTTRNRQWRLDATIDSSINSGSQHVTGTDGWRLSADTTINQQRASVEPISFTSGAFTVWQSDVLPFAITTRSPRTFWVDFDDVVRNAVLNIASTGATVVSTLTAFATRAKIELSVASGTGTVSALSVQGRLARRAPTESYVADDLTSQALPRGIRAGSDISGEYLGVLAEARGLAAHIVWRFADPQLRPTMTVENWFPTQFDRDLYDVLAFTSAQLLMTGRLFEIVGLTHEGHIAASTVQHHVTTYVLQESRAQTDPGWFILDSSLLDGPKVLTY